MVTLPVRIQKMVGKLHDIGYESLYLYSGSSPNGMNWRYTIGIINNIIKNGLQMIISLRVALEVQELLSGLKAMLQWKN